MRDPLTRRKNCVIAGLGDWILLWQFWIILSVVIIFLGDE